MSSASRSGCGGSYDLEQLFGISNDHNYHFASPMSFLANLRESGQLARLRQRFILLAFGQGRWEEPSQSRRLAEILGANRILNFQEVMLR